MATIKNADGHVENYKIEKFPPTGEYIVRFDDGHAVGLKGLNQDIKVFNKSITDEKKRYENAKKYEKEHPNERKYSGDTSTDHKGKMEFYIRKKAYLEELSSAIKTADSSTSSSSRGIGNTTSSGSGK